MGLFQYSALNPSNSFVRGKIQAKNLSAATVALEQQGLLVVNVRPDRIESPSIFNLAIEVVSAGDKIAFTRNLQTMLESGISLDQAVKITAEQTSKKKFREALIAIYKSVERGQTLSNSLAKFPKYFSPFYVNLVAIGEKSGNLDEVLAHLLEKQEKEEELSSKARSAMIYPVIIIIALLVMVTFMMLFVIPKITGVLTQYDVRLPLPTRILIAISSFLVHFGWIAIPVFIFLVFLFFRWTKSKSGKPRWDNFTLGLPRIGTLIIEYNLARFARSMSAMLRSGISIDQALQLSSTILPVSQYNFALSRGVKLTQKGAPLTEVLKGSPQLFTPLTIRMVEVGEMSGRLEHMLSRLAIFYEKSVDRSLTNLSSIIEPVLLLAVGATVGLVAMSVLMPIWSFSQTV